MNMKTAYIPEDITPPRTGSIPDGEVRAKLFELLGLESIPEYADSTIDSEEETCDGMTLTHLHFSNLLGERVRGILLVPSRRNVKSGAGLVCLPGSSGDAGRLTNERFCRQSSQSGPLQGWARELTRRGFVTLSLSIRGNIETMAGKEYWENRVKFLSPYGRTQMGVFVDEAIRGALILAACDEVDPERIGMTGMSLGGNVTWYAMACTPWIYTAAAVCGGIGSMALMIHESDNPNRHGSYFYVPHMLRFFDHPRVVRTCIAPRPFMLIAPTRDEDMPAAGVDDLIRHVSPAYASARVPEGFKVYKPETNHVFLPEFLEWMAAWFRTHLLR
jgi:hypothetical protein